VRQFSFPSTEHLKLRNRVEHLFANGDRIKEGPLRVLWIASPWPLKRGVQILFNAPKRRFKLAVRRNRIKRVLREAWRLERGDFPKADQPILMAILHQGSERISLDEAREALRQVLVRIAEERAKT